ncbi:cupin domain-containing protein [Roseobacter weihaiensis]|uniref:cupin domain-containing protein n=1 Tax=Roseobacter weihaiensis TaxID=2763262 RepID=UPI001D09BD96|nr:cupin domain-containing protein [Roseobacter sp. H9]
MDLNADFSKRALVHTAQLDWQASPMPGVDRRMLDRIGGEVARATSIVRYAPQSHFSEHTHAGGEEFIVLEGVFSDDHGDFPAGSYVRNPPTSAHTPRSEEGCTIFVKLWQFQPDDRTHVVIDMTKMEYLPDVTRPGIDVMPLFQDAFETVRAERWAANTDVTLALPEGGEFLVLDGDVTEGGDVLQRGSWLRLPVGSTLNARAGRQGVTLWVKLRHIPHAKPPGP